MDLKYIKSNFSTWNKKEELNIGNNRIYKIIGCGRVAFKVLVFAPQEELEGKGGWDQKFWKYQDITKTSIAAKVIEKLEEKMKQKGGNQTTL